MPSQLVCRPEQDLPVAVLSVSGTLDRLTGDALGLAVRRSLAVQPVKLLLDVSRLKVADPLALGTFGSVVCQTAEFPNVPIVVCGADPGTCAALAAAPDCAAVEMATDCAAALAEAGRQPLPESVRIRLRPVPDACRQVRHLVDQACARWHRTEFAATAALIATELVANVVRHAHTTMVFTLGLRDGTITMAVRDGSRRLPRSLDPGVSDAGGRGLRLVRELSAAWGVLPVSDGKVVWTQLTPALR
ncbi:diguanylate cyclase [Actinoplanes sp. SE50]|uniref:ATP-binding protein n=1 Tax=unclassified Actinoplanes TaxID=2626549 RepID=UPI00023ED4A7|nr:MULTISPECIES: ATP-binding protein [unclassified Actinoplanes]AEV86182.1 putative PAS/PAC sensor protein [Actinoplanes sp. SE50/110]ATO84580.1 diguanylate cyclase [Actinoplanes sp. SE50]SLM01990.1 diguanylate cyclase [Actinoplanes sp. SE50/110]